MPRTKKPGTNKDRAQAFLSDFKRKSALELKKLELDLNEQMNKKLAAMDSEFNRFPPELQNLKLSEICEILNEESSSEEEIDEVSVVEKGDSGYGTTSSSGSKQLLTVKKMKVPRNMYLHAPKDERVSVVHITPKIGLNEPTPVTRFARQGETVVSMTGSPILAPSTNQIRVPNVSVPLNNGDVINIAPTASLRQSILPTLDPITVDQLRKLKEQIEKFL